MKPMARYSSDFVYDSKLPYCPGLLQGDCFHSLLLMFPFLATSFGIALPAWIVDQKNSMLVYIQLLSLFRFTSD